MEDHPRTEAVSVGRLRRMFNEARLWDRARYGDLWQSLEDEGHPSPPLAAEPICTRSQIVAYRDDNARQIARVHQYVRPDGRLGGDERPDPQAVLGSDGILYVAVKDSPP